MQDSNINIYLNGTDENGTQNNPVEPGSSPDPENPSQQKQNKGKGDDFDAKALGLYVAKQAFSMATQRVGQVTRNSALQDKVNAGLKIAGYSLAIAKNPVMGTLALGFDLANSLIDYNHNASIETNALAINNRRAGNVNRSRDR